MNDIKATVLISTYNRAELLRGTLHSLAALRVDCSLVWDVVVVDNNSSDRTREVVLSLVDRYPAPLHYMVEPKQGKSAAVNAGLAAITAPIVVFTDDDVQVAPQWLSAACKPLVENSQIDYTGGPVRPMWEVPPPPWLAGTGKVLWGTLAILDYGSEPFIFEDRQRIPLGVNWAARLSLLHRVGGVNQAFGPTSGRLLLGQAEAELFARTRAAGARGLYVPEMEVHHHIPAKRLSPAYGRRWWYGKGVSRARLQALHPVTETGLDLRNVPTIAGIPRFLFGSAARDVGRWAVAVAKSDKGARIATETQLFYFVGQVRERICSRWRRARPGAPTADPGADRVS